MYGQLSKPKERKLATVYQIRNMTAYLPGVTFEPGLQDKKEKNSTYNQEPITRLWAPATTYHPNGTMTL